MKEWNALKNLEAVRHLAPASSVLLCPHLSLHLHGHLWPPCSSLSCQGCPSPSPAGHLLLTTGGTISPLTHFTCVPPLQVSADTFSVQKPSLTVPPEKTVWLLYFPSLKPEVFLLPAFSFSSTFVPVWLALGRLCIFCRLKQWMVLRSVYRRLSSQATDSNSS